MVLQFDCKLIHFWNHFEKKKNLWLNTIGIALLVKSVFGIIVLKKQTNIHLRLNQNNKVRFAVGKWCHSRQLPRRLSAKKSSTRPAKTTDNIKESRRHPVDTKRTVIMRSKLFFRVFTISLLTPCLLGQVMDSSISPPSAWTQPSLRWNPESRCRCPPPGRSRCCGRSCPVRRAVPPAPSRCSWCWWPAPAAGEAAHRLRCCCTRRRWSRVQCWNKTMTKQKVIGSWLIHSFVLFGCFFGFVFLTNFHLFYLVFLWH